MHPVTFLPISNSFYHLNPTESVLPTDQCPSLTSAVHAFFLTHCPRDFKEYQKAPEYLLYSGPTEPPLLFQRNKAFHSKIVGEDPSPDALQNRTTLQLLNLFTLDTGANRNLSLSDTPTNIEFDRTSRYLQDLIGQHLIHLFLKTGHSCDTFIRIFENALREEASSPPDFSNRLLVDISRGLFLELIDRAENPFQVVQNIVERIRLKMAQIEKIQQSEFSEVHQDIFETIKFFLKIEVLSRRKDCRFTNHKILDPIGFIDAIFGSHAPFVHFFLKLDSLVKSGPTFESIMLTTPIHLAMSCLFVTTMRRLGIIKINFQV